MKKLPIGLQNIVEIIEEDYLYVDKTRHLYDLIKKGKLYFLSRPRRFGKTLLLAALKEIFSGNKALFKDLYIGTSTDYDWPAHPVLQFNFATFGHKVEALEPALQRDLHEKAKKYGVQLERETLSEQVNELVMKVAQKNGSVVLLIDEYDKPLVDFFTEPEKAKKNRDVLRDFFSPLKDLDTNGHLRFLFITGVSKFSKVSLFSDLNNLTDLTMKKMATDMIGITHEELLSNFQPHIEQAATVLKVEEQELLKGLKQWYDGYSWDGSTFVYNPFSLLSFFFDNSFKNYWFSTGTPTFLVNAIRDLGIEPDEIENRIVNDSFFEKFDIDQLDLHGLLFQTGYLTVKNSYQKGWNRFYELAYPNEEVQQSFNINLLEAFTYKVPSVYQ